MERISSSQTFVIKRAFPVLWFGFVAVLVVIASAAGAWKREPILVIQPLLMIVIGYFLFRKLVWDLADEVRDGGGFLLVSKGRVEERIALADVMNVNFTRFANPPRITLVALVGPSGRRGGVHSEGILPAQSFRQKFRGRSADRAHRPPAQSCLRLA